MMVRDHQDDASSKEAGQGQVAPDAPVEPRSPRVDHDLVRRAQKGDEAAFAALVERNQRRAWRVARNMVPRDDDADDIVQEAFMRVFRSMERFDFKYAFTTWLYRIVTNLAIDHLRKRRPIGTGSSSDSDEDVMAFDPQDERIERPDEAALREERALLVRACIDSLAPHFKTVMALRELDGMSCAEIADIVGATNVTVRWRLHRGRKLFQDEWERRNAEQDETGFQVPANRADTGSVDQGETT